jgi:two-component system sensor histidine kinase/response regulator
MSEHDVKSLFIKPFYQTSDEKSKSLNQNGHGLGLNISYNIAKLLGGSLEV